MARKRRRNEPSGRQIIQAQQMFQNLLVGLDTAGVQRLLEGREVLAAMADGRLSPKKALGSLGLPVKVRGRSIVMDFFGLRKDALEDEIMAAFGRQGLRPANEEEYKRFREQHPEVIHDLLVRSRLNLIVMAKKFRQPSRNPREIYWGFPVYSRNRDGVIERYEESEGGAWDKTYRFLGVRLDTRPDIAVIPSVSTSYVSPKVRPMA
jgi:hypothetical protein